MNKKHLFDFPYEFPSAYSTESETDDEELAELTRRFSPSLSLQQPYLNFKIRTSISNGATGFVANKSHRGVIVVPHAYRSPWEWSDGVGLFRQQHFCRNRGVSAWPPPQVQNQRLLHHQNQRKLVVIDGSGGGGNTAAKRECVGTGVFLPRIYCHNPPETGKRQANLPAGMIQSSTKSFVPITTPPQLQAHINGGFVSHYELLMGRKKAMISGAQQQQWRRSNIDGVVMESPVVNNPAVLLPQEWTY